MELCYYEPSSVRRSTSHRCYVFDFLKRASDDRDDGRRAGAAIRKALNQVDQMQLRGFANGARTRRGMSTS
jgi:hypothetical protein